MFDFTRGCDATPGDGASFQPTPVTAESFLPPQTRYPRAWQRVAVAPVPGPHRQRKIWKRVGGVVAAPGTSDYVRAMAELARDGQGERKRQRQDSHIPVWGDARWDAKVKQPRDGKWDLVEARAAVGIAKKTVAAPSITADNNTKTRPTTFPEEPLKRVPRKRHNSRWPIEPKMENATRMMADLQPLIEFDMPASPEAGDVTLRMDEKQMSRRSTRRLSRRFSLFLGEDSPRKLPMISLSPAKKSAPMLSPVKRRPVTLSPTKVIDSPHRSFRMNATPTKVVLESPKSSPPQRSPLKLPSSPIAPTHDAPRSPVKTPKRASPTQRSASPAPLMFDQPTPDMEVESQYEARRRLSLQSARRNDRGLSGISRLFALKAGRNSPNRRHSFTSLEILPEEGRGSSKSRRNTLDTLCVGPDALREGVAGQEGAVTEEVVEIDMKTSLDIFGQASKAADSTMHDAAEEESEEVEMVVESESPAMSTSGTVSPARDSPASQDVTLSSPSAHKSGVTQGAGAGVGDASPHQAAASPNANEADIHHESIMDSSPQQLTFEELPNVEAEEETEEEQSEMMFEPCEPEGLSTIYEESSIIETQASELTAMTPTTLASTVNTSTRSSLDEDRTTNELHEGLVIPPSEMLAYEAALVEAITSGGTNWSSPASSELESGSPAPPSPTAQLLADEQLAEEAATEACGLVNVSTNHVATASDALSHSDSPQPGRKASMADVTQPQTQESNEDKTSLIASEQSVSTPAVDDDVFGAASPEPETNEESTMHEESSKQMPFNEESGAFEQDVLPLSALSEESNTPSKAATLAPVSPTTPTQVNGINSERLVTPEAGQPESSGFTPINTRQISPPHIASSKGEEQATVVEAEHESDSDLDADDVIEEEAAVDVDDEAAAMDEDDIEAVEVGLRVENDTLQLQALHDHSDTEMLRQFVTRVTADKNAKAAAAAAALAIKAARPKRRSGSTGSVNASTGSPIARAELETPANSRKPLGEKSPNSPSPTKKRKLDEVDDSPAKDKSTDSQNDAASDPSDGPRLKRRRKRADPVLETPVPVPTTASATPSPEPDAGPRRSTRARNTRVALRPAAPSANSVAFSMIPVRLPGMGAMDDAAYDAQLAAMAARQRSAEKDLAAVTRGNTRKNKAGAIPPQVMLARQAEDPKWDMGASRVKKGEKAPGGGVKGDGGEGKERKGVRWAEELVQFQSSEGEGVYAGMARGLLEDVVMGEAGDELDDGVDEIAEAAPPAAAAPPVVTEKKVIAKKAAPALVPAPAPVPAAASSSSTRRSTRSSRLQAPTPVKKMTAAATASAPTVAPAAAPRTKKALPKLAPAPAPTPVAAAAAAPPAPVAKSASAAKDSSRSGMATRRTRIAKLGMSGNGTPAPKRRGRPAAV